jgi:hypothetical protein
MELFTTMPIKLVSPTKAVKEKELPVINKVTTEPTRAKGMAEKTINGWL